MRPKQFYGYPFLRKSISMVHMNTIGTDKRELSRFNTIYYTFSFSKKKIKILSSINDESAMASELKIIK